MCGEGERRDSRHTSSAFPAASRKAEGVEMGVRGHPPYHGTVVLWGGLVCSPPPHHALACTSLCSRLAPAPARHAWLAHIALHATVFATESPSPLPADLLLATRRAGVPSLEAPLAEGSGAACRGLLPIRDARYCCRIAFGPTQTAPATQSGYRRPPRHAALEVGAAGRSSDQRGPGAAGRSRPASGGARRSGAARLPPTHPSPAVVPPCDRARGRGCKTGRTAERGRAVRGPRPSALDRSGASRLAASWLSLLDTHTHHPCAWPLSPRPV